MGMTTIAQKSRDEIRKLRERAEEFTVRNDRQGYDSFWADDELVDLYLEPARVANFRHVAELCADWGGRVVDLGCGSGTMLQELLAVDRSGSKQITGIDYAASSIDRCRKILPQANFIQRDLCKTGLPDLSVDLLLSIQTMEHLADPAAAMKEMWRLLSPGGRLVITIPNGETDTWEGHCNFWTIDAFLALAGRPAELVQKINDNRNLLFVFANPAKP